MQGLYQINFDPPRGSVQIRLDERGRAKLPANFHRFLNKLDIETLFATTVDCKSVRLYLPKVWNRAEAKLEAQGTADAEDLLLVAHHFGADCKLDEAGRVPLPDLLREELGLEKQAVWLKFAKGRFLLETDTNYQQRLARAREGLDAKVATYDKLGVL